jgi:hypothetical protein
MGDNSLPLLLQFAAWRLTQISEASCVSLQIVWKRCFGNPNPVVLFQVLSDFIRGLVSPHFVAEMSGYANLEMNFIIWSLVVGPPIILWWKTRRRMARERRGA